MKEPNDDKPGNQQSVVTLEVAVKYKNLGYSILVDPEDEAELARWEQLNRDK